MGALTPDSPEGSAQVTSTHCFWQACLLVCSEAVGPVLACEHTSFFFTGIYR